ncbi:MAG TPA: CPBP family intramembrane glutamic endopeptidase [Candidatus Angelobacter sp.]
MILVSVTIQHVHLFWTGEHLHARNAQDIFAGASTILLVAYITAAPIFEETLVRGYLMTELIGLSWPAWLAAGASVALQTSYHLYYGLEGALSLGAGFVVSAVYFARSRRLMPVILSHLLWDLTATYFSWHR